MQKNLLPKLKIHLGFHKTGTTTIQKYLYENSELFGYFYPKFENLLIGTCSHLGFSNMDLNEKLVVLNQLSAHSSNVMLSNEELFISLTNVDFEDFKAFTKKISELYSETTWIITLRDVEALLSSALREYSESSSIDHATLSEFCVYYFEKMNLILKYLIDAECNYVIIRHSEIPIESNLIEYFCKMVFFQDVAVVNNFQNASIDKGITSVFISIIRSIYSNLLNDNMYSDKVRESVEFVLNGLKFEPEVSKKFERDFSIYIKSIYDKSYKELVSLDKYDFMRG